MPSLSTHYYTRLVALSSTEAYMVMMVMVVMMVMMVMVVMVVGTLVVVMTDLQSLESFSFVHLLGLSLRWVDTHPVATPPVIGQFECFI